jgi:2-hydroxychromene-2-carboxylate isomerase
MAEVDFYFDFSCPWTYMAFTRLQETAKRTGSTIIWHPFLLDDLLADINPALRSDRGDPDPRRSKYGEKDIQDWATFCNLTIEIPVGIPGGWPLRPEVAACGAVVAAREGRMPAYGGAVFRACFEAGLNIGDPGVVTDIAVAAGFERDAFDTGLRSPDVLQQVKDGSRSLLERGGFGSPTMFVGESMFFGNDRMPLVEFALGQTSERTFVMPGQHG